MRKVLSSDKVFQHTGLKQKTETVWRLDQVRWWGLLGLPVGRPASKPCKPPLLWLHNCELGPVCA